MSSFIYNFPGAIHAGWRESENISNYMSQLGEGKTFIVTDKGVKKSGIVKWITRSLDEAMIPYSIFDEVQPNPTEKNVYDGVAQYREENCDSILAVGGGSPIDAAKGMLVMARHPGILENYYRGEPDSIPVTGDVPPFMAVPTTSGTGSEVSRGAIITDENNRKRSVGSRHILPKIVILDPQLTVTMPPKLTAYTGLDAISHSVEAIAVNVYAPIADAFAREGLRLVSESLVKAYENGSEKKPRMDMMYASSLGALAFQKGLGVIHSLAHQLSTQCNIPHGAACGLLIPHAIRFNLKEPSTHRAYREVAEIFTGRRASSEDAPAAIEELIQALNVPSKLGDWGVTEADIDVMAPNAILDHCHPRNPRKCSEDDMRALYRAAM
jgi:4-hydroxybutyrate dehydrogenase